MAERARARSCLINTIIIIISIAQIRIRDGDAMPDDGLQGRPLRGADVAVFGTFVGAAVAQNEIKKRAQGLGGGGADTDIFVVTYQLALYDTHGVLAGLQRLARRADTATSAGLASLASSVCLELLRSYEGWVASKAASTRFRELAAAERELREETGCRLGNARIHGEFFSAAEGARNHVTVVTGTASGEPCVDGREIIEAAFVPLDLLPANIAPASLRRLIEVRDGLPPAAEW